MSVTTPSCAEQPRLSRLVSLVSSLRGTSAEVKIQMEVMLAADLAGAGGAAGSRNFVL
jgi:hypothetical protein